MTVTIRTIAETGSTNADLLAAADTGAPEGTWLRADRQSGGRGRLGRSWVSPPGNLHASTIVRLHPGDPEPASLALVASVALHEVASAWAGGEATRAPMRIKWPNDLMADGAKLAGILLERSDAAIVIGFGVNLAHRPEELGRATTSFASLGLAAPEPEAFLDELASALARWVQVWRAQGLAPVRSRWLAATYAVGTPLVAGGEEGLFDGLEADGALRLRLPGGEPRVIRAGDVFLS